MSLDYTIGSRPALPGPFVGGSRTGSSAMAIVPSISYATSIPAGAFVIPGQGSINRPPPPVVSYLNAASFRIEATLSGNGLTATFNEVIDLGVVKNSADEIVSPSAAIPTLAQRWQWAIRPLDLTYTATRSITRRDFFNESESGQQDVLTFAPLPNVTEATNLFFYYPLIDQWEIRMTVSIGTNDGEFFGDSAGASLQPSATTGPFTTDFEAFGVSIPLRLTSGSSCEGSISVESWLPTY